MSVESRAIRPAGEGPGRAAGDSRTLIICRASYPRWTHCARLRRRVKVAVCEHKGVYVRSLDVQGVVWITPSRFSRNA